MSVRVFYEILNQRGTPAMFTDTLANRPAFGFAGRLFISTDSGQIFEDTGSAWTLVADAGVGGGTLSSVCLNGNTTATGIVITAGGLSTNSLTDTALTAGSITFAGTGGLISQDNTNLFWDNTLKRLGIGVNSPSSPLDIHATGTNATFNGTGSNNAYLVFQNAGVNKWRIGNTYNAGANSFDIFNTVLSTSALSISNSSDVITINYKLKSEAAILIKNGATVTAVGYTGISSTVSGLLINLGNSGYNATLTFQTGGDYTYTYPATTGTLALTSQLTGTTNYLPKFTGTSTIGNSGIYEGTSGFISIGNTNSTYNLDVTGTGRFTGALTGTSATFSGSVIVGTTALLNFGPTTSFVGMSGNNSTGSLSLYANNTQVLGFAASTGAATFSSNITMGGNTLTSTGATGFTLKTTTTGAWAALYGDTGGLYLGTNAGNWMFINNSGNVLIGTTTDNGFSLQVNGSIWGQKYRLNDTSGGYVTWEMENTTRWRMNYLIRFSGYGAGALTTDASGNVTAASDSTLKDIIKPVENVLDRVMDFEPVYFKWNEKTDLDKENVYISTIAQSIEKGFPEAVGHMSDGTLTVQDRAVLAIAIRAIQELKAEIDKLKNN